MGLQAGSGGRKVCGLLSRWFDLLSSGKTPNLEFSSLFCSATPGQVPRITLLNNRAVLNNILHSHVLAGRRREEKLSIYLHEYCRPWGLCFQDTMVESRG